MVGKDDFKKHNDIWVFLNDSYANCFAASFLLQGMMNKSSLGYPLNKKGKSGNLTTESYCQEFAQLRICAHLDKHSFILEITSFANLRFIVLFIINVSV